MELSPEFEIRRKFIQWQPGDDVTYAPLACDCYERGSIEHFREIQIPSSAPKGTAEKLIAYALRYDNAYVIRAISRKTGAYLDVHRCRIRQKEVVSIHGITPGGRAQQKKRFLEEVELLLYVFLKETSR